MKLLQLFNEIKWRLIEIQWRLTSSNQKEIISTNYLLVEDLMKIHEAIALEHDEDMIY